MALARYQTDGALDPAFGQGGRVAQSVPDPSAHRCGSFEAVGIAAQRIGRLVVAEQEIPNFHDCSYPTPIRLLGYRPDGRLDKRFGARGLVADDFGVTNVIDHLQLLSRDRLLVSAITRDSASPFNLAATSVVVARYLANGAPDRSFGSGGRVLLSSDPSTLAEGSAQTIGLHTGPGGTIDVVRVNVPQPSGLSAQVLQLKPDGSLDQSFGVGGRASQTVASSPIDEAASALAPNGKIVVAARVATTSQLLVMRLNRNGTLDESLGTHGRAFPSVGQVRIGALEIDASGRALLGGERRAPGSRHFQPGVFRFAPGGTLDKSWGDGGFATVGFRPDHGAVNALERGPSGTLYAAGSPNGRFFGVARLRTDGAPSVGVLTRPLTLRRSAQRVRVHVSNLDRQRPVVGRITLAFAGGGQIGSAPINCPPRKATSVYIRIAATTLRTLRSLRHAKVSAKLVARNSVGTRTTHFTLAVRSA